ncbi:cytochrome P450 [Punctularia strigosozonata HHB-11173 SS5]|uniref:cytochrome P450 n=1 Tax=Punctularia strigosozonata (strain HHB-11173) TaxID=741275 RepID=UPI000441749C|nr:cytochrome P450 [Punctularia strigosozonata HHB-11173 SS5]EIN09989.1 cytochrome P450 [Punctularia strigosozonata HHB-11173 SS5]
MVISVTPTNVALAGIAAASGFLGFSLLRILVRPLFSPLRYIPGPPGGSLLKGHADAFWEPRKESIIEEWIAKYGHVLKFKNFLNSDQLLILDTRAIQYVLNTAADDYVKSPEIIFVVQDLLGVGVLLTEGEQHRRQRRILNAAFGPAQIRDLTEIFVQKATQLRDGISHQIAGHESGARVDVLDWMSKATLDIIGAAGFNYDFDALDLSKGPNELNVAFTTVFESTQKFSWGLLLQSFIPATRFIPSKSLRLMRRAKATMDRLSLKLVREQREALLREKNDAAIGKEAIQTRDLLSLLIKANMASDIPESQRMSEEEVLGQIPTFLGAGHDTTANSTSWCLYLLACHPDIQKKLREELLSIDTDSPSMDQLSSLPFFDSVIRESLRVLGPVPSVLRVARKDDVIPLEKPYVDTRGRICSEVRVQTGDTIFVPIIAMNTSTSIWGADAKEFRPERWGCVPDKASAVPGIWSNLMTFLAGPHHCIGYRFSLIEMKALLFALLRAFEFELAVPREDIMKVYAQLVTKPMVATADQEKQTQLPFIVKPFHAG